MTKVQSKYIILVALFTAFTMTSVPLQAAVQTGYSRLSSAALQRAGLAFNANQSKASECYNALVATDASAAGAGYYTYLSASYVQYFSNYGQFYFNAFYAQGFVDLANIAAYASEANTYSNYYNSVAISYRDAYSSLTAPNGPNSVAIATSTSRLNGFLSQNAYNLATGVEVAIASQFGGSSFQYSLIYNGVALGLQEFYTYLARQIYQAYVAAGDTASGEAYGNYYLNLGVTGTRTYAALGAYYYNLVIAFE